MADGVIDTLSIEVGASSTNAVKNINALADAMRKLKDATGGMDSGAAGKIQAVASALKELAGSGKINISAKLGENIGKLAGSMKAVRSEDISMIRQLANAVKTLDGTKSINISSKLADNITNVAAAADLLKKEHSDKLKEFGDALKAIGGNSININKNLADRLTEIASAVDVISNDTLDKIRQLTKALARLKGMGDVKIRISGVGSASASGNPNGSGNNGGGANNSGQSSAGGDSGTDSAYKWTWNLKNNLDQIKKNSIDPIITAFKSMGVAISYAVPGPLKLVASILGGILKTVWNIAKGIAKWAFNTAINAVKTIWNGLKKIASTVVNIGKNLAKKWWDNSAIKTVINGLEKVKSIISTFGRIAFYRAVRSAIKYITDALIEGEERAYWFSKKFGNATSYISKALDRLSSAQFKMSNQLGAAWSTLIATIEPILIQLIELVTRAAEAITQFFAALGGKTTYLKATNYAKDWADETEKGNKAAKEWKNQLMGFDEINRLEAPSDTSTSDIADKYKDYENMFEESDISDFFKRIKELIDSGEWGKLGTMLGEKFNDLVNNFDWAGWGSKIGRGIQHGIDLAYNFLNTADFKNVGTKIADFFNKLGDEVNFEQLGRTVRKLKLVLWNVLYGAVTGLEWDKWAGRISDYIIGSLNELADWLESLEPDKIAKALSDFFGNIKYEEIWVSFLRVVQLAWSKLIETKDLFMQSETGQKVTQKLKDFFANLTWDDIKQTIKGAWTKLWSVIDDIWPKENREQFGKDLLVDLKALFENVVAPGLIDITKIAATALWEGIKASWNILKGDVIPFVTEIGKSFGNALWDGFKDTKIGKVISVIAEITSTVNDFINPVEKLKDVANLFGDTWDAISTVIDVMKTDSVNDFNDIDAESGNVASGFTNMVGTVKQDMADFTSATNGTAKEFNKTVVESTENTKISASDVADALRQMSEDGTAAMYGLSDTSVNIAASIISAFNSIISKAREAWEWVNKVGTYSNDLGNGRTYTYKANSPGVFASGGFPEEDGFFWANHNELVGKFANGKTAVANNEQITDGIATAVYNAFMRANADGGNNRSVTVNPGKIYINGKELMRVTYDDRKAVDNEHGASLLSLG